MKELGGFFEIELSKGEHYHKNCININSGRSGLKYILKLRRYTKIYIPYYICNSVVDTIKSENISYAFYYINNDFSPMFNKKLLDNEAILYVNYFGLFDQIVNELSNNYENLIVDNTQGFFSTPLKNTDTFYSARKFFGVSDGGYVYTEKKLDMNFKKDLSYHRMEHLLKRRDCSAQVAYNLYKENESQFSNSEIKMMSNLTNSILESIDYQKVKERRFYNFKYVHSQLKDVNQISLPLNKNVYPMTYPLLIFKDGVKEKLISKGIYIPTYWDDVENRVLNNSFEWSLYKYLIPLPIDQRYNADDIDYLVTIVKGVINIE